MSVKIYIVLYYKQTYFGKQIVEKTIRVGRTTSYELTTTNYKKTLLTPELVSSKLPELPNGKKEKRTIII